VLTCVDLDRDNAEMVRKILFGHRRTHTTHRTDCCSWTTKVVGNDVMLEYWMLQWDICVSRCGSVGLAYGQTCRFTHTDQWLAVSHSGSVVRCFNELYVQPG